MTAARQKGPGEGHVRTVDPFRDLEAVVDLISIAFGERLDPAGEATLARMRRFARSGPLLQWAWALLGRTAFAPGLVWEVDGRVVGNVSVRRARGGNGYLVGNVVVHPDRRGEGIASTLMRRAIKAVYRRGAQWVGLEVRTDNEVARGLYERMGFQEVGRTRHLLRDGSSLEAGRDPGPGVLRRGRRCDGDDLVRLMEAVIPEEQRPLLEIEEADYHPGWQRRMEHWLRCEDEIWWILERDDEVEGGVRAVHKPGAFPNRLEVLVEPGRGACFAVDLVRQGVASFAGSPDKPVETSLPEAMESLVATLKGEGFHERRVLIQMKRNLRRQIPVPRKN